MSYTHDASGLLLIVLPLPPPGIATITAYDHLLAGIAAVESAYMVPGLLLGEIDTPTYMLVMAIARKTDETETRKILLERLQPSNWAYEVYPFMLVEEGTPFVGGISQIGIQLGRRERKLFRVRWQGFDGIIPDVPQQPAEWVSAARSLSDLLDADVVTKNGDSVVVPEGHAIRTYAPRDKGNGTSTC